MALFGAEKKEWHGFAHDGNAIRGYAGNASARTRATVGALRAAALAYGRASGRSEICPELLLRDAPRYSTARAGTRLGHAPK